MWRWRHQSHIDTLISSVRKINVQIVRRLQLVLLRLNSKHMLSLQETAPAIQTLFMQHKTAPTEATVAIIPALTPLKVSCKPLGSGARLPRTGFPIRYGKHSRCHLPRLPGLLGTPTGGNSADGYCGLGFLRISLLSTNLSDAPYQQTDTHTHTSYLSLSLSLCTA